MVSTTRPPAATSTAATTATPVGGAPAPVATPAATNAGGPGPDLVGNPAASGAPAVPVREAKGMPANFDITSHMGYMRAEDAIEGMRGTYIARPSAGNFIAYGDITNVRPTQDGFTVDVTMWAKSAADAQVLFLQLPVYDQKTGALTYLNLDLLTHDPSTGNVVENITNAPTTEPVSGKPCYSGSRSYTFSLKQINEFLKKTGIDLVVKPGDQMSVSGIVDKAGHRIMNAVSNSFVVPKPLVDDAATTSAIAGHIGSMTGQQKVKAQDLPLDISVKLPQAMLDKQVAYYAGPNSTNYTTFTPGKIIEGEITTRLESEYKGSVTAAQMDSMITASYALADVSERFLGEGYPSPYVYMTSVVKEGMGGKGFAEVAPAAQGKRAEAAIQGFAAAAQALGFADPAALPPLPRTTTGELDVAAAQALIQQQPALKAVFDTLAAADALMVAALLRAEEVVITAQGAVQQLARTVLDQILGKDLVMVPVRRHWMCTDGQPLGERDLANLGVDKNGAPITVQRDARGWPHLDPMKDVYRDDKNLTFSKASGAARARSNGQKSGHVEVKPNGGVLDPKTGIRQRVEIGLSLKPNVNPDEFKTLLRYMELNPGSELAQSPLGHIILEAKKAGVLEALTQDVTEWADVTQIRHKFEVKNTKTGTAAEVSLDMVHAKTVRNEHQVNGQPQEQTYYVIETELDHLQLNSSNTTEMVQAKQSSALVTTAAQEKWLQDTAASQKAGTAELQILSKPQLHSIDHVSEGSFRQTPSYRDFESMQSKMLAAICDGFLPGPARQKASHFAELLSLVPPEVTVTV